MAPKTHMTHSPVLSPCTRLGARAPALDVVPGLSLLVAGTAAPHPQELLISKEFLTLLQNAQRNYGVVIHDTSPALESADAHVVASRVGSAILVARRHRTKVKDIEKIASTLTGHQSEIAGKRSSDGSDHRQDDLIKRANVRANCADQDRERSSQVMLLRSTRRTYRARRCGRREGAPKCLNPSLSLSACRCRHVGCNEFQGRFALALRILPPPTVDSAARRTSHLAFSWPCRFLFARSRWSHPVARIGDHETGAALIIFAQQLVGDIASRRAHRREPASPVTLATCDAGYGQALRQ